MSVCPRCDRSISSSAIRCPHCQLQLAAHGHAGMSLHRASSDIPLCASCAYEADNSCTFPKRPTAMTCTLYQDVQARPEGTPKEIYPITRRRKYGLWMAIAVLIVISLLITSL